MDYPAAGSRCPAGINNTSWPGEWAYGTSQKVDRLNAVEFAIRKVENKTAYEVAGLSYDTKFDLRNMVELPWSERYFSVPPNPSHGKTPKLGSLHIGMHRALNAAAQAIRKYINGTEQFKKNW